MTNVILAAVISASQLPDINLSKVEVGLLGISVAVLTAIMGFWKADAHAQEHRDAGNSYLTIMDDADCFINIECQNDLTDDQKLNKLGELAKRMRDQDTNCRLPPWWLVILANRTVKVPGSSQ